MPGITKLAFRPFKWLERKVLFAPERSFRGTPDHVGLAYEDIFPVTADAVKLHGWHIRGNSDVVWLIFKGNGGNISVRLDQYQEIHRRYDASIVAIDYRGYGRSEGTPSESGLYADALAAYDYARTTHPGKKVVLFGRSMGAAVAAQLASVVTPTALILEAAILSIPAVMLEYAPWTRYTPVRLLIRAKFDTRKYAAKVSVPKLLFHGDSDTTVSYRNSELIFDDAADPKQIHIIPGGGHDGLDMVDPEAYHAVLQEFLTKYEAL